MNMNEIELLRTLVILDCERDVYRQTNNNSTDNETEGLCFGLQYKQTVQSKPITEAV